MDAPSRTVTDKVVDGEIRRLSSRLEKVYQECCPHTPAGSGWFDRLDRAEAKLHELLAVRPLSKAEIRATVERAFKALRAPLQDAKRDQPRYREAINIQTGESRPFPDYGS